MTLPQTAASLNRRRWSALVIFQRSSCVSHWEADVQRVSVLAIVFGPGVVGLEERRNIASRRQQRFFFGVERLLVLGDHAADLAG